MSDRFTPKDLAKLFNRIPDVVELDVETWIVTTGRNELCYTGWICIDGVTHLLQRIKQAFADPLCDQLIITINSDGGYIDGAYMFYDFIRRQGLKDRIIMRAHMHCFSAAITMFTATNRRIADEHTVFMYHKTSGPDNSPILINVLNNLNKVACEELAAVSNCSASEWLELINDEKDHEFTTRDMYNLGVVTKIGWYL